MTPWHSTSTNAAAPTIIVISPGFHSSLCRRITIQARMNGAITAASRIQRRMGNICQALIVSPPLTTSPLTVSSWELGLVELVPYQGRKSDSANTSAATQPASSPNVSLLGAR